MQEELYKKDLSAPDSRDGVIPLHGARHPGVWGQVGLGKLHYEQR